VAIGIFCGYIIIAKNKDSPNTKPPIAMAINTFDTKSFKLFDRCYQHIIIDYYFLPRSVKIFIEGL